MKNFETTKKWLGLGLGLHWETCGLSGIVFRYMSSAVLKYEYMLQSAMFWMCNGILL